MINCNDCVTLSDDEPPDQEHEKFPIKRKRRKHSKKSSLETIIVLDEEPCNGINNNNNIIKIPISKNSRKYDMNYGKLEKIHKEDKLFSEFIEKCLNLENSDGMIRVVSRNVINAYEASDKEYRKSAEFKRVLLKAMQQLDTDPDHKFSHVKCFVDTLIFHKAKRRVQLTTLASNLKENAIANKHFSNKSRRSSFYILDSDDEQKEIPTINLDDDQNEVIDLDERNTEEEKENQHERHTEEEKENQKDVRENINIPNSQENFLVPRIEVSWERSLETDLICQQVIPIEYEPPTPTTAEAEDRKKKIQIIESQIALCKELIAKLDEAEVDDDSMTSPYILCEKYKVQIVELYKELCKLNGEEPIKRRKVRLRVLEGHPSGPVKRLESFINDNIGEDGNPLFPDFCDVVKCVMVANIEDKLGWSKPQVMNEAHALFTHCGRALQKQRQRREYRDLLAKVKVEADVDPADEDPELMRRLERNRKVAVKNEYDLLERYVNLQYLPPQKQNPGPTSEKIDEQIASENQEPAVINDEHSEQPRQPSPCELISDEDSNFEPPEVNLSQEKKIKTKLDIGENKEGDNTEVNVKQEPADIIQMLEELGDNYTTSVIDIEDPFLVIEISSDDDESSDEDVIVEGESDEY